MNSFVASLRLVAVTLLISVAGYAALMLGFARIVSPDSATGSLIKDKAGTVVGSRLIAQKFTQPQYFRPRPSAVDYNAAGAGGSNKSPTNPDLAARAATTIESFGATNEQPLPADLAAASGGGLDPHITLNAALYQAERVAGARAFPQARVEALIRDHVFAPGGMLTPERLVNVLELNLALDELQEPKTRSGRGLSPIFPPFPNHPE